MEISNPHNLLGPAPAEGELRYGIRLRFPSRDPIQRLLDPEWHQEKWFRTREERDAHMAELARRHPYNRIGDYPQVILEPIER